MRGSLVQRYKGSWSVVLDLGRRRRVMADDQNKRRRWVVVGAVLGGTAGAGLGLYAAWVLTPRLLHGLHELFLTAGLSRPTTVAGGVAVALGLLSMVLGALVIYLGVHMPGREQSM